MIRLWLLLSVVLIYGSCMAQPSNDNCASASQLCANIPTNASNIGATTEVGAGLADAATPAGNFCFEIDNSIWFTFTTNSVGGAVDVDVSNINCIGGSTFDTDMQGVIIDAGTPCDESTYTSVSNCVNPGSSSFTLSAAALLPNTTYYVHIDGDITGVGITDAAQCDFTIEVSGAGVDVTATTTTVDETCGATDGQIDVTSVSGGQSPYTYSINGSTYQASNSFPGLSAGSYTVYVQDASGCIFNVSQETIGLIGGPTATVITVTANCNANDGEIHVTGIAGGTAPYTFSINGGTAQASPDFLGLGAGVYSVTIIDATGCPTTYSATILNATGPTSGTPSITDATCANTDGEIVINGVAGGTTPYTYDIGGGPQASNTFSNLTPGSYDVLITDAAGCEFTIFNIVVTELPGNILPSVTISTTTTTVCENSTVNIDAVGVNGGANPNYEFFINGTSVQSGSSTSYSSSTLQDGDVITVEITSDDPCVIMPTSTSNSVVLTVVPETTPTVIMVPSTTSACYGDPITFTATSPDCATTGTFDWYVDGGLVQSETTGSISTSSLSDGASVSVILNCDDMCTLPATSNTEVITVTELQVDAGPDIVIYEGQSTQLQGSGSGSYSWTPAGTLDNPSSATPNASPSSTTTYTLSVTNNGCTETDVVTVTVIELIYPPNTFTPNGDGVNDTWHIRKIDRYPTVKVNIYDRWGQKVFNSIGYGNGQEWDGTNRGLKLPAATYYYVIDLNTEGGDDEYDVFAGSITIIY